MKYFVRVLLTLSIFFGFNQLLAIEDKKDENYLTHSWIHDEEYLFLNIAFSNEFELSESSVIKTEDPQIQGFKILLKPRESGPFSSKGELKNIQLSVWVKNLNDPNKIAYRVKTTNAYLKYLLMGTTTSKTVQGPLSNPAIDLMECPVLVKTNDESPGVMIRFKNSFPVHKCNNFKVVENLINRKTRACCHGPSTFSNI